MTTTLGRVVGATVVPLCFATMFAACAVEEDASQQGPLVTDEVAMNMPAIEIENLADGVRLTITSDDEMIVARLQEHANRRAEGEAFGSCCGGESCGGGCGGESCGGGEGCGGGCNPDSCSGDCGAESCGGCGGESCGGCGGAGQGRPLHKLLASPSLDVSAENLANGVRVTVRSEEPGEVERIQELVSHMATKGCCKHMLEK